MFFSCVLSLSFLLPLSFEFVFCDCLFFWVVLTCDVVVEEELDWGKSGREGPKKDKRRNKEVL